MHLMRGITTGSKGCGRRIFLHHTIVATVNPSREICKVPHVVGHHNDGSPCLTQGIEKRHYLTTRFGIEVTSGLVGKYQPGRIEHGTCNGYTLLLTSGELVGLAFYAVGKLHLPKHLFDTCITL